MQKKYNVLKDNFILSTVFPKKNKYRIKFLELVADKIYSEEGNYVLRKIENKNFNLLEIAKNGKLSNREYEMLFHTKEEMVEYLNSKLKDFDEYLSINLLNWFYNYSCIFLNNEKNVAELNKIVYELSTFISDIDFIYFKRNDFLIEYIDYFISDLLIDINLNYLESSLIYELKQFISGLLLLHMQNADTKKILNDLTEVGDTIIIYEKVYNIHLLDIIDKIIESSS